MVEQLPIQSVEKPIICNPCEEPNDHWLYDKEYGRGESRRMSAACDVLYKT